MLPPYGNSSQSMWCGVVAAAVWQLPRERRNTNFPSALEKYGMPLEGFIFFGFLVFFSLVGGSTLIFHSSIS